MRCKQKYIHIILAFAYFVMFCTCQQQSENKNQSNEDFKQNMVLIPQAFFQMGNASSDAFKEEQPVHKVKLSGFYLDKTEVSNKDFMVFVKSTGYVTTAEKDLNWEELKNSFPPDTRKPDYSMLKAASLVFYPNPNAYDLHQHNQWWDFVQGANWKHPQGPKSTIEAKKDHPVVHVSWFDAQAYCKWKKKRLPTEAEWEWAARGAKSNPTYPWGDQDPAELKKIANFFQGQFPMTNLALDGYAGTAPVASFPPNGYGLYDMAGNVWEWCADYYDVSYYDMLAQNEFSFNPMGPKTSNDPDEAYVKKRVVRGGSFLCNQSYCSGYRVTRRMKSDEQTSFEHTGFRCACDSL